MNLKCEDSDGGVHPPICLNGPSWRCDKCEKMICGRHGATVGGRRDLCSTCVANVLDAFEGWVPGAIPLDDQEAAAADRGFTRAWEERASATRLLPPVTETFWQAAKRLLFGGL
jgi:hypothetical protein